MISFSVRLANIANRKRYRFGKPRNHNGFWVFYANFQDEIQKISFPQNDLWGGLELNTWAFMGRFCDLFRRVCPFFERYFLYSDGILPMYRLNVLVKKERLSNPQKDAVWATVYPSDK